MLTKEDTTADELGVTDADVAEWDAIYEDYLARREADPSYARPWQEVLKDLKERAKQYQQERHTKA